MRCLPHGSPPSFGTGIPRLIEKSPQLWKGKSVKDALLGEEGGAVKLGCQEFGNQYSISDQSGAGSSAGGGGGVTA
jgi:hypothetical protein